MALSRAVLESSGPFLRDSLDSTIYENCETAQNFCSFQPKSLSFLVSASSALFNNDVSFGIVFEALLNSTNFDCVYQTERRHLFDCKKFFFHCLLACV